MLVGYYVRIGTLRKAVEKRGALTSYSGVRMHEKKYDNVGLDWII